MGFQLWIPKCVVLTLLPEYLTYRHFSYLDPLHQLYRFRSRRSNPPIPHLPVPSRLAR